MFTLCRIMKLWIRFQAPTIWDVHRKAIGVEAPVYLVSIGWWSPSWLRQQLHSLDQFPTFAERTPVFIQMGMTTKPKLQPNSPQSDGFLQKKNHKMHSLLGQTNGAQCYHHQAAALQWLKRSAEQGHVLAQNNLGVVLATGWTVGVLFDPEVVGRFPSVLFSIQFICYQWLCLLSFFNSIHYAIMPLVASHQSGQMPLWLRHGIDREGAVDQFDKPTSGHLNRLLDHYDSHFSLFFMVQSSKVIADNRWLEMATTWMWPKLLTLLRSLWPNFALGGQRLLRRSCCGSEGQGQPGGGDEGRAAGDEGSATQEVGGVDERGGCGKWYCGIVNCKNWIIKYNYV